MHDTGRILGAQHTTAHRTYVAAALDELGEVAVALLRGQAPVELRRLHAFVHSCVDMSKREEEGQPVCLPNLMPPAFWLVTLTIHKQSTQPSRPAAPTYLEVAHLLEAVRELLAGALALHEDDHLARDGPLLQQRHHKVLCRGCLDDGVLLDE